MLKSIWDILELAETEDASNIKKAYRAKLKTIHPEDDPKGFMELREAYEAALDFAKSRKNINNSQKEAQKRINSLNYYEARWHSVQEKNKESERKHQGVSTERIARLVDRIFRHLKQFGEPSTQIKFREIISTKEMSSSYARRILETCIQKKINDTQKIYFQLYKYIADFYGWNYNKQFSKNDKYALFMAKINYVKLIHYLHHLNRKTVWVYSRNHRNAEKLVRLISTDVPHPLLIKYFKQRSPRKFLEYMIYHLNILFPNAIALHCSKELNQYFNPIRQKKIVIPENTLDCMVYLNLKLKGQPYSKAIMALRKQIKSQGSSSKKHKHSLVSNAFTCVFRMCFIYLIAAALIMFLVIASTLR